jgi:serine/threonine-protein kinase RsbW
MTSDYPPLTLTLPSDLRMLSVARAFIDAVGQVCELDRSTVHALVLATGEAVSNVVRHAHQDRPGAQLQVQCRLCPGSIEILLLDEGDPFDITAVPHLDPGELRVGGRGVFLMRALMDELSCQPRDGRGNILRMVKHRPTPASLRECG